MQGIRLTELSVGCLRISPLLIQHHTVKKRLVNKEDIAPSLLAKLSSI